MQLRWAWSSIEKEAETLNLDAFQRNQAKSKREQADDSIRLQVPDAYCWLLVPTQELGEQGKPQPPMEWHTTRLQGADALAPRASKRLVADERLFTQMGGGRLKLDLDRVPLWRGDHVPVRQLIEDFAKYLYLPRLRDHQVLEMAVVEGVRKLTWMDDSFALAERFDEAAGRYIGLVAGHAGQPMVDGSYLVVKAGIAQRQLEADRRPKGDGPIISEPGGLGDGGATGGGGQVQVDPPRPVRKTHFYGSVDLSELKLTSGAQQVADEIVKHLVGRPGARVRVRLEVEATDLNGFPEDVVRTVGENAGTLKFSAADFEEG